MHYVLLFIGFDWLYLELLKRDTCHEIRSPRTGVVHCDMPVDLPGLDVVFQAGRK